MLSARRAHPRSRGENAKSDPHRLVEPGSSPLTRGKPLAGLAGLLSGRLIPAHAGKTREYPQCSRAPGAHPRSRGENIGWRWYHSGKSGSSPLTRGKLDLGGASDHPPGLIPAHAGKTPWRTPSMPGRWAHPRSRGENLTEFTHYASVTGSSPLTRGKQSSTACPAQR